MEKKVPSYACPTATSRSRTAELGATALRDETSKVLSKQLPHTSPALQVTGKAYNSTAPAALTPPTKRKPAVPAQTKKPALPEAARPSRSTSTQPTKKPSVPMQPEKKVNHRREEWLAACAKLSRKEPYSTNPMSVDAGAFQGSKNNLRALLQGFNEVLNKYRYACEHLGAGLPGLREMVDKTMEDLGKEEEESEGRVEALLEEAEAEVGSPVELTRKPSELSQLINSVEGELGPEWIEMPYGVWAQCIAEAGLHGVWVCAQASRGLWEVTRGEDAEQTVWEPVAVALRPQLNIHGMEVVEEGSGSKKVPEVVVGSFQEVCWREVHMKLVQDLATRTKDTAQGMLDVIMPEMQAVMQQIDNLSMKDTCEARSLKIPPPALVVAAGLVRSLFELGYDDAGQHHMTDYKWLQMFINDRSSGMFLQRLQWYDKDNIPERNLRQLRQRLEEANLDWESQPWFPLGKSTQSHVASAIARWALFMLRYGTLAQLVEPLRSTFYRLEEQLSISLSFHKEQHTYCSR